MLGNKPNTASQEKKDRREVPEVLIVEDNPDNMVTIKAIIGDRYVIKEAYDGLKGLQYIVSGKPDLVLLDISLPKIDGIEIVKMLKAGEETKHIPVIAVTARAGKEDEEELLEAGCDDYISKPVDAELLIKKLEKWLVD
jgi:CheY-like chemotaxis protein